MCLACSGQASFIQFLYTHFMSGSFRALELKESMLSERGQLSQPPLGAPRWPHGDELATVEGTERREKASVSAGYRVCVV